MQFNITLVNNTYLPLVILSRTKNDFRVGEIKTKEEFLDYLQSDKIMYFCGDYVQGGISHPKVIKDYEIIEDNESLCTLICSRCGEVYNYIPAQCKKCGNVFVD